ncbi:hypothetical protein D3C78_1904100 [compost metagenome]
MTLPHPDYKLALANLRKVAKLEAKKAAIEQQIEELGSDQFLFDEAAFNQALRDRRIEIEESAQVLT